MLDSLAPWHQNGDVAQLLTDYAVNLTLSTLTSSTTPLGNTQQTNVALQFPDAFLHHAPVIAQALSVLVEKQRSLLPEPSSRSFFFFILADTSYSECCVDEVAANHLATHLIIHYATTCLSPTRTLPTLYVFPTSRPNNPHIALNILRDAISKTLSVTTPSRLVLLFDLELHSFFQSHAFIIDDHVLSYDSFSTPVVAAALSVQNATTLVPPGPHQPPSSQHILEIGPYLIDTSTTPLQQTAFLWLTTQQIDEYSLPAAPQHAALSLSIDNNQSRGFMLQTLNTPIDQSNPPHPVNAYRVLRKRFALLHHIENATRIAIVPGTLSASGAVAVIKRCKRVILSSGKRPYELVVGKPTPAKLANFPEIDVFVFVACPYSALIDSREYLRPIVTPLELEAALLRSGDLFSTPYSTDWRKLSDEPEQMLQNEDKLMQDEGTNVSHDTESALVPRGDWQVSVNSAGSAAEYLKNRIWTGLRYDQGGCDNDEDVKNLPARAEKGQYGRSSAYDREKSS